MPIYAYRCAECGFQKDFLQKISDPPLTDCPQCGKAGFSKMLTAAGFQLKGSGWYVTDFRNSGSGATAAKTDDAKSGEGKEAGKADGAKPEAAKPAESGSTAPSATPSTSSSTSSTSSTTSSNASKSSPSAGTS